MNFIITSVLFVIIAGLSIANYLLHNTRLARLINIIPGPRGWPIVGNSLDLLGPVGKCYWLNLITKNFTTYGTFPV